MTDSLTTSSTATEISNALYYASIGLPYNVRECSSFSVTKTLSGNDLFLRVQFNVDNSQPLSLLEVFTADLTGEYLCDKKAIYFSRFFMIEIFIFTQVRM